MAIEQSRRQHMAAKVSITLTPEQFDTMRRALEVHAEYLADLKAKCTVELDKDTAWEADQELRDVQGLLLALK